MICVMCVLPGSLKSLSITKIFLFGDFFPKAYANEAPTTPAPTITTSYGLFSILKILFDQEMKAT